jgi:hypothetical protein
VKLTEAARLLDTTHIVVAERLIREAIDIHAGNGNSLGVADGHEMYGLFFRSPLIESVPPGYRRFGFHDKEATYENRFERALVHFERAAAIFRSAQAFDRLASVEFNMGATYALMRKDREACAAYDASEASQRRAASANPSYRPRLPVGMSSWGQYVAYAKQELRCAS